MITKEWQPIATAPKDGTQYLGWGRTVGFMVCNEPPGGYARGRWSKERNGQWSGMSIFGGAELTHWLPLPKPPKKRAKG